MACSVCATQAERAKIELSTNDETEIIYVHHGRWPAAPKHLVKEADASQTRRHGGRHHSRSVAVQAVHERCEASDASKDQRSGAGRRADAYAAHSGAGEGVFGKEGHKGVNPEKWSRLGGDSGAFWARLKDLLLLDVTPLSPGD